MDEQHKVEPAPQPGSAACTQEDEQHKVEPARQPSSAACTREGRKADFVPEYRNASHPWLVEAPEWHHLDRRTTTQATYTIPKSGNGRSKGRRRELLEKFFWEQMANEVLQDFSEPMPIEKYSSEYDASFNIPDYKPALDVFVTDSELHTKYPLYTDGGLSYWQHKYGRQGRGPFRRNSLFSTPMGQILDEPPGGL